VFTIIAAQFETDCSSDDARLPHGCSGRRFFMKTKEPGNALDAGTSRSRLSPADGCASASHVPEWAYVTVPQSTLIRSAATTGLGLPALTPTWWWAFGPAGAWCEPD